MRPWSTLPRPFLAALATLLAAASVLYGAIWMYDVRHARPSVELGFNKATTAGVYDRSTRSIPVFDIVSGSPAEHAGLRVGDRIVAVNGQPLITSAPFDDAYSRGHPGDAIDLTVERPGEAQPRTLHGIFRATRVLPFLPGYAERARISALQITGSFPVLFLVVGFVVLLLRLDDANAWLLALLFCGFVAVPDLLNPAAIHPGLREFAFAYRSIFSSMLTSFFYIFFAVFPVRSPLDRRFPWLKWLALALGMIQVQPWEQSQSFSPVSVIAKLAGEHASRIFVLGSRYTFLALGLISLAQNSFAASVPIEARRKSRVIFWGTLAGVMPIVLERAAIDFADFRPSFWLDTTLVLIVFVYPLSFAYAVVKHRVMEIPVLLRRSARYVLVQRGFFVLLFAVAATAIALFTHFFSRFVRADTNIGMALSAVFGIVLVWVSAPFIKRGTDRIDRAFFRSAYDARIILQDLAEKTRTVTGRSELAALLEDHLSKALRPKTLACYAEDGDARLVTQSRDVPPGSETLPANLPLLNQLAAHGKSLEVSNLSEDSPEALSVLAPLNPECLVPILRHDNRLSGLIVLGPRLSEEPYSSEDKHLLDSVASQAGIALENIHLAGKMAARMEADRRVARDMEIAREVQARLFPQAMPPLQTLDYAGTCIQARVVGGDYYDFLDLGPGRLGVVLADISGKGIAAALLMANLQANLRSQYAVALEDPHRLLQSVNSLFYENTPDDRYATLFFADYDDASHCLRYANCGHNPPLLLRVSGELERLGATATVLGLFKDWKCGIEEISLRPGDTLLAYTDGVTEASNSTGEEFGEARLEEIFRSHRHKPVNTLLACILEDVQKFSGASQADDLTLFIAKSR
jgi:phosphoserine phosphatase RsbU/P